MLRDVYLPNHDTQPFSPANAGRPSRFQSGASGPAWLASSLGLRADVDMTAMNILSSGGKILALVLLTSLGACGSPKRNEQLFLSCQNHRAHLSFDLNIEFRAQQKSDPPHQPNVPGYEMLAMYAGRRQGALNCNHGALGSRIGGWQAVNLPPEQWRQLHRKWSVRGDPGGLPFYWCGKPNPLQRRVFCTLSLSEDGWLVEHEVLAETTVRERIAKLNEYLTELGVAQVSIDVPDGIQWSTFEAEAKR